MDIIRSFFAAILILITLVSVLSFDSKSIESDKDLISEQKVFTTEGSAAIGKAVYKGEVSSKEIKCSELGFQIKVPDNMSVDESHMPAFVRISSPDMDIKISRERSPYADIDGYFNTYLYKYMLDPKYREANGISLITNEYRSINGVKTRILVFSRKTKAYTHGLFITGDREFYSCFIRYSSLSQQEEVIKNILNSFKKIERSGEPKFNIALKPEIPDWNNETKAFYSELRASDTIKWGIFYPNSLTKDFSKIESMERELEYKFPIILHYIYLGHEFPAEGMEKAFERGKTVELTMQVMWNVTPGNTDDEMKNVNFELLDGLYDDYLRKFAQDAKAFGHPFIFRLNNEMNSTWVRYSGIALLCDPDVYIKVWRHIYDIFEREGVKNAIWVFNPNDVDYPPLKWNSHVSYYPGNKYVHMIGLTGYNTGTYYKNLTGERWRSFIEIYDPLNEKCSRFYGEFPWIITEFACSSVGGDKEKWIKEMFRNIYKYKNLKAAVWWSYADYDYSKSKEGSPARRYWLDEKPEYLKAFKEGLQ